MTSRASSPGDDQRRGEDGDGDPPTPSWILSEPGYSLALQRGLAILATFTPERPTRGIQEIAHELGMHKSTTHRYVSTLVALGYLEQGATRRYRLTLAVIRLGLSTLSATPLEEHAHPYMQALADGCGYTIGLAVLDGPEVLQLDRTHSSRPRHSPSELIPPPGSRLPVHCTAPGKLLLAHLPEPEQAKLLRGLKLTRETPSTITDKRALREEIERIAREGRAVEEEELTPGQHAIATPIRSADQTVIAALSMTAATSAITPGNLVRQLAPHLTATAERISARLG